MRPGPVPGRVQERDGAGSGPRQQRGGQVRVEAQEDGARAKGQRAQQAGGHPDVKHLARI